MEPRGSLGVRRAFESPTAEAPLHSSAPRHGVPERSEGPSQREKGKRGIENSAGMREEFLVQRVAVAAGVRSPLALKMRRIPGCSAAP